MIKLLKKGDSPLPGFGLSLGYTVLYLSVLVLLPLATIPLVLSHSTLPQLLEVVTSTRVLAALRVTLGASLAAAITNLIFGGILAWVLVRYTFPGRRLIDGLIDLPFALPTAVAGISLTTLYAPNGWFGAYLSRLGINVAYSWWGIYVALIFVGLPFVVRTLQPVIEDMNLELEEAAATLGASRWKTVVMVILPELAPAMITGITLAFARGVGEYGSIVFISGNMPFKTEILPLLIMSRLEQYDYRGASALALLMLIISFSLMLAANWLQAWVRGKAKGT